MHIQKLEITAMAYGGRGVARSEGKVYFVSGALLGDVVEARITKNKKTFAEADVVRFIERSPQHRTAPCPYASRCGGCQWQEAHENEQREWKIDFVRQALKKFAGYDLPGALTLHASPDDFSYRNRIQLKIKTDAAGHLIMGYFARGSHELVSIDHCMIAAPTINEWLKDWSPQKKTWPKNMSADVEVQEVAHLKKLLFHIRSASDVAFEVALKKEFQASPLAYHFSSDQKFVEFDQQFDLRFFTAAGLFQQVNRAANHLVRERVLALVQAIAPKTVFDVFCGSGNLSLPLAKHSISILGVEKSKGAIAAAQHNARENRIDKATYLNEDAAAFSLKMLQEGQAFDLVMVDPPRAGLLQTLEPLLKLQAHYFLYLSCDPNTLARDLQTLLKNGYEITHVEAFDFFPQTYHVETLVMLKKV